MARIGACTAGGVVFDCINRNIELQQPHLSGGDDPLLAGPRLLPVDAAQLGHQVLAGLRGQARGRDLALEGVCLGLNYGHNYRSGRLAQQPEVQQVKGGTDQLLTISGSSPHPGWSVEEPVCQAGPGSGRWRHDWLTSGGGPARSP